jgi:type II secretory pathway component PulF
MPTQILIVVSTFMANWWWAILTALVGCVALLIAAMRKKGFRRQFDRMALRLPLLGKMLLRLELSRVAQALGALLNSGVRILEALRVAGDTVGNLAVREVFPQIVKSISTGETLASACQQAKLLPPLMVNLIRTGEETGQLPEMLSQLADIYEEEAERTVTAVVRLLEPALIIVLGAVIATIVAAVMLPVFRASSMVS